MIVVPDNERNEDYYEYPICIISWVNFDYKENGGKKTFLACPKDQYGIS